jgi:RNA polymerase sigma factor (sigma-70 family)
VGRPFPVPFADSRRSYGVERKCQGRADIIRTMHAAKLSDDELIAEYRGASPGDRRALADELFSRHYERVARWCYRFAGTRESAADLAQDVFLKAHRHLDTFKGTSRFSTWLYVIVRNEAMNRFQPGPPIEDDEILATLPTLDEGPEELAARQSRRRRLMEFLSATLDQTEQIVFTLHYGDDMPLEAISRLLRLENTSGAKAYIVSAKRKLARAARRLRMRGEAL